MLSNRLNSCSVLKGLAVTAFRKLFVLTAGLGLATIVQPSFSSESSHVIYRFPNVANLGALETRVANSGSEAALDRITSRRHKVATAMVQ